LSQRLCNSAFSDEKFKSVLNRGYVETPSQNVFGLVDHIGHSEGNIIQVSRRIRIGLLTSMYSRSGIEHVAIAIANMSSTHPYQMNIFSAYPPDDSLRAELLRRNQLTRFHPLIYNRFIRTFQQYIGPGRYLLDPFDIKRIQRMVDVVINIHSAQLPITRADKPYVAYIHFPFSLKLFSFPDRWYNKIQTPLFQLISNVTARKKDGCKCRFVCNSNFTKSVFIESWPELYDLAIVIHPPVNVYQYLRFSSKEPRSNTIVAITGFERSKRIDIAISAMELIKKEFPTAKLVIIGSMRSPFSRKILTELKTMVAKKRLENNVSFLPNAKDPDKTSILASAKVLLHPTPYEHFGISIAEGMASGCVPVVPRNGGPYLDVIDKDRYGLSFTDKYDLADKVVRVLTNDQYRIALKEKAIQRSLYFTSEIFEEKLAKVIDDFF